MANTLQIEFIARDIDANNTVSDIRDVTNSLEYTISNKYQTVIPSDNAYKSMPFGAITAGTYYRISTDQTLSGKFNGGSTEYTFYGESWSQMAITALQLKNNSGTSANVVFEVYGS